MKARWRRRSTRWGKHYVLIRDDGQWLISIKSPGYADGIALPGWHWRLLVGVPWEGSDALLLWRAKADSEACLRRMAIPGTQEWLFAGIPTMPRSAGGPAR